MGGGAGFGFTPVGVTGFHGPDDDEAGGAGWEGTAGGTDTNAPPARVPAALALL